MWKKMICYYIRGDKSIYYSVAYQYMMGNQAESAQKGLDSIKE